MTTRSSAGRRSRGRALVLTVIAAMLVWFALWGAVTPVLAVTGLLVGVVAVLVFPLPVVEFRVGVHPIYLTVLIFRFLADVVVASAQVAWVAIRPRPPRSDIVTVALTTNSDLVQTLTAIAVSLVPGSLIIDADPELRTLTIHVLDVQPADETSAHRSVLAQEQRILRALAYRPEPKGVTR